MGVGLAVRALQMALSGRSWKAEGLIRHSDRGIQYASSQYTELLEKDEIQISISRRGNPYDNARAERFMRTLKEEEVYQADYRDLDDALLTSASVRICFPIEDRQRGLFLLELTEIAVAVVLSLLR